MVRPLRTEVSWTTYVVETPVVPVTPVHGRLDSERRWVWYSNTVVRFLLALYTETLLGSPRGEDSRLSV